MHKAPNLVSSLLARLGLRSLRGRYLYVAGLAAVLVVALTWLGEDRVTTVSRDSAANARNRQEIRALVNVVRDRLWHAHTALQQFLLAPNDSDRDDTVNSLFAARHAIRSLLELELAPSTLPDARAQLQGLDARVVRLIDETNEVIRIRVDTEALYPAVPIMLHSMLPAVTDFYSAASLAMLEADELGGEEQAGIYRLFNDARHGWVLAIASFRNWITSRFGIFADPALTLEAQLHNISLYLEGVDRNIDQLTVLDKAGKLYLQQNASLPTMKSALASWRKDLDKVVKIYTSDRWRQDLPLLRDAIHPLFTEAWSLLSQLDKDMEAHAREDVKSLVFTADRLSRSLWFLSGFGLFLVALGFILFERLVRLPVARVAHALREEAKGGPKPVLPRSSTTETHALIEAFNDMREQVHSRQERLETILDNAAEGIVTFDENGVLESFNHAAEKLFGYDESEVVGKELTLVIPPPDALSRRAGYLQHFLRHEIQRLIGHETEVVGRHKDGSRFPLALKISTLTLQGRPLYTGLVADISERKAMMEHLKQMAEHDGLTGLYNRGYFQTELERVVERVKRTPGQMCALMYIDLDNFKYVNDTLGHAAGDKLLIDVAMILNKRARKSDVIARFGGDEFSVLLYNVDTETAKRAAESFRETMTASPFKFGSERVEIACSIGVSLMTSETKSAADALSQADIACHLAKRAGRNRVHVFEKIDETKVTSMSAEMGWSQRIRDAIRHSRFALACQPIIELETHRIESYEVLIRMVDENEELIMPAGFLPIAERFGLMTDIDKWVITNAVDTLTEQRRLMPDLRYSINLSGQSLLDPSVFDLIAEKLATSRLPPAAFTFEVTETVAIADMVQAESFLSQLRAIGCETALDDFGAGFSSFAYLQDLPVDRVKIDGRFVKNLANNAVDQAMVKAMNEIAHALGKKTVAEFVENEESLHYLKAFGVDYAQGYHLGRPDVILPCKAIADRAGARCLPH